MIAGTTQLPRATIDATTSDGGRVSGTLAFDPGGEGMARYQAELTLSSLNLMTLTGDTALAGEVGGVLNVDLEGPSRSKLGGTASVKLDPLRLGALPLRSFSLQSTWSDGQASLDLMAAGEGLRADLSGQARPMDATPSYDLGGSFSVDLPRDSAPPTRLAGSISLRGEGISPDSASAEAEVQLSTVMLGTAELGPARLTARLDSGRIVAHLDAGDDADGTLTADATLDQGRLRGTGRLRSTGGRFDFEVDARPFLEVPTVNDMRVDFAEVDLGALTGDTASALSTRLSGSLSGSAAGTSPESLVADLSLQVDSSRVARQLIDRGEGSLAIREGRVDLRAELTFPDSGGVGVSATARPFDDRPTARVDSLTFRALDPGAFAATDSLAVSASLNGSASGRLEGLDPATMSATGSIRLDASRVQREPIREGQVELRVAAGRLESEARIDFASGTLTAEGSFGFAANVPDYALTARLAASRLDRIPGADSTISKRGHVDATLRVAGRGTTLATMEAELSAFADSAAFGDVRVDTLRLVGRVAGGIATLDTLTLRSNVLTASGAGSVAVDEAATRPSDLRVSGEVKSLTPLEGVIGMAPLRIGTGNFDLRITGPPNATLVTASADASALLFGTTELVGLKSSLEATLTPELKLGPANGRLTFDRLTVGARDVRLTEMTASWDGEEVALEADATLDDRRQVSLTLRADPHAQASRLELDRLDIRVDGDQWKLVGSPTVSWGDGIQVDSLALRAGDQAITLDGRLDLEGSIDLVAAIDQLRIGGIADLVGLDRLDGTMSATLDLEGPATSPRIRMELSAELSDHTGQESTVRGTLMYDTLRLEVDASVEAQGGGRVVITGGLPLDLALTPSARGDSTRFTAAAPGRADLDIRADSFQVAWFEPFLDPAVARGLQGRLQADAEVGGTQDAPVLTGQATVRDARLTAPGLGVSYENVGLRLSLQDDVARVDSAFARTGDGTMSLSGTISLPELSLGEFDLEASLHRFQAMNNDAYRMRVSGTAALRGTTAEPLLEGDLDLVETDVYLDAAVSSGASVRPVELTDEEIRQVEEYLGISISASERDPSRLFDLMKIDLSVNASRDTWVRQRASPEMEIQLTGGVRVTKEPSDSVRLDGEVDAVPSRSYVEQFGRRFSIRRGRIELRGTVPESRIDMEAVYTVPSRGNPGAAEATITMDVEGTLNDLSLTLGSEPEMENADIVSYLATGRPASTSLSVGGDGGGGFGSIGSDYALGRVTGLVEGLAAEGIGLDVVEIEADGLRGATLVAGRFVSPRVYVGFKQPIGRDARDAANSSGVDRTEVEVEYEALKWLLLNMEASNSTISFFFRFRYAY